MVKYYLTLGDRDKVQATITRVNGGGGNNRPIARRRRIVFADSPTGAALTTGVAFNNTPAASVTMEDGVPTITVGESEGAAIWPMSFGESDAGDVIMQQRTQDDEETVVELPCLNVSPAALVASETKPKIVQGYIRSIEIGGTTTTFFVVTEFVRNSVIHGFAPQQVTAYDSFTVTSVQLKSGTHPQDEPGSTDEPIAIENPFGFELDQGAYFRAEQADNGEWVATQAECPT